MKSRIRVVPGVVLAVFALAITPSTSWAQAKPSAQRLLKSYGKLPLNFEVNRGQANPRVRFLARGPGYTIFLMPKGAELSLASRPPSGVSRRTAGTERKAPGMAAQSPYAGTFHLKLIGSNAGVAIAGADELPGRVNYFIGNDPKKWQTNIPTYARVAYQNIYPGIDLVYYGNQGQMEYDFVVHPGANPNAIRIDVAGRRSHPTNGGQALRVAANGDLVIQTGTGQIRFCRPEVYQETGVGQSALGARENQQAAIANREFPSGRFVLLGDNEIGFQVSRYDKTRPLVIDPVLAYSTYLGDVTAGTLSGLAVDSSGNAYVVGTTTVSTFPTTTGGFAPNPGGVFVSKFNPSGSALLYSTFIGAGGSGPIYGDAIAVDSSGDAYVTGTLQSFSGFPLSGGAYTSGSEYSSAFFSEIDPTGSSLLASGYIGGSNLSAEGWGIAVDTSGNIYLTGMAQPYTGIPPATFPVTSTAFQTGYGGGVGGCFDEASCGDAFFAKLTPGGTSILYATYLGGSGGDLAKGIAVDSSGDAYITGLAESTNFPTTTGAYQTALQGSGAAFVAKIDPTKSGSASLIYSTLLGSTSVSKGMAIAVDSAGDAFVTGYTESASFPVTSGAYENCAQANGITCTDTYQETGFVTDVKPAGAGLNYSTYFPLTQLLGISVDSAGDAFVGGNPGAAVGELDPTGSSLLFQSSLGSSLQNGDSVNAVALDASGASLYVAGVTPGDIQTTTGAYDTAVPSGLSDAFVAKFSLASGVVFSPAALTFAAQAVGATSAAQSVTLTNNTSAALSITGISITGTNSADFAVDSSGTCSTSSSVPAAGTCTIAVTFTPSISGSESATLSIADSAGTQTVTLSGTGTAPVAALSPASLTFASQTIGTTSAAQSVTLSNSGNAGLTISSIAVSGDFAQTTNCLSSVSAGASCSISVTFMPTTGGSRTGTLTVTDNAANTPQTVSLSGNGVAPAVTLSATSLTFASQTVGTTSAAQTVTLTNTGSGTLNITGITVSANFSQTNTCGLSVTSGATCTISVSFSPKAAGTLAGSVSIADNAANSPQTIGLTGTATSASGTGPAVSLSTASLTFSSQTVGTTSAAQGVTVTNGGNANLTFAASAVTISGSNVGDFAVASDGCSAQTIAPSGTCAVSVTFKPSVAAGESATLNLADNAANSPQAVSLTGTGVAASGGGAQKVLYSFTGTGPSSDGFEPYSALIMDASGNLYGTTLYGGPSDYGTVFEMVNASGSYTEKVLYSFTEANGDGGSPMVGLVMDAAGDLFGTTEFGGTAGMGAVFELAKSSGGYTEKVLFSFAFPSGSTFYNISGLVIDSSGNLYGTACYGGASGLGSVFELVNSSGSYTEKVLYSFTGVNGDGEGPVGGLAIDASGNLYGTTSGGGASGDGTIFELANSSGSYGERVLYSFSGPLTGGSGADGANPQAGLVVDSSGDLFGTTGAGGASGVGTIFELANSSGGYAEKVLYSFSVATGDDVGPEANLFRDTAGNLYGTTYGGGTSTNCTSGCGTAFELANSSGSYTAKVLYNFTSANGDGGGPAAGLIMDASGNLFGTTVVGGASDSGTVFEISSAAVAAPAIALSSTSLTFASQTVGTTSPAQNVTVTNSGNANLTFAAGAVTASGTNAADFAVASDTCSGQTLPPSATCAVGMAFRPSIAGSESATLNFADNAANSPQTVSLSGTGVGAPAVTLSATSLTFASQTVGVSSAAQSVTVSNNGNANLSFTGISITGANAAAFAIPSSGTSCSTTTAVAASSSCTIAVTFTPSATGSFSATLSIADNASGSPQTVSLSGTGVGVPAVTLSTSSLAFGSQNVGASSSAKDITVTNSGSGDLTFATGAVTLSGTNAADFAISSDTCSNQTVAPTKTCLVSMTFKPSAAGSESATLNLTDNAANSPQTVTMSGTGVAPDFSLGVASGASASATVSPGQMASYSLSVAPVGGFKQTVTFTCSGAPSKATCTVSPSSVTLDGSNAQTVSVSVTTTASSLTIPPGPNSPPISSRPLLLGILSTLLLMILAMPHVRRTDGCNPALAPGARLRRTALAAILLGAAALAACGGGGGSSSNNAQSNPGTPAGTYTLTVNGTSSSLSQSTTLTLTVQ